MDALESSQHEDGSNSKDHYSEVIPDSKRKSRVRLQGKAVKILTQLRDANLAIKLVIPDFEIPSALKDASSAPHLLVDQNGQSSKSSATINQGDDFCVSCYYIDSELNDYAISSAQKGTQNFTTLVGQGAYCPVYKAQMSTGEIVAVKLLATDSKQGEREFETEVKLLGRLHLRNLLNLLGYCTEKGKNMLIYAYMSNGSPATHLYISLNPSPTMDINAAIGNEDTNLGGEMAFDTTKTNTIATNVTVLCSASVLHSCHP
uniref:Protein kinase domain-containing protein n=1 Tax=Chenopodium quinoa TaxID=63459 RepID=A0A803N5B1_CHEQI